MPLLHGDAGASSPNATSLPYDRGGGLEAVRSGCRKLHLPHRSRSMEGQPVGRGGVPGRCAVRFADQVLHDLEADPGESRDLSAEDPEVPARMRELVAAARADPGDDAVGGEGTGRRAPGREET